MENIYLGSQLFINKTDTPDMVRNWVRQMDENGLKIIRLFMIWEQLEPYEGQWDFTVYDACFNEAEKLNMLIVPTLLAVSPPGWMRLTKQVQATADLDDLNYWENIALPYVNRIVTRYKDSPALHSWILWNEPARWLVDGPHSIIAYRKFLKELYLNDINLLNKRYYKRYLSFDEVTWNDGGSSVGSFMERVDMLHFVSDNQKEKIADLAAEVKKIDVNHMVHINTTAVGENCLISGQSIWKQAEVVDFIGCSAHPPFLSRRFPADRVHQSQAYFADLMKSSTPHKDKLFWVTELQGGHSLFCSPVWSYPSPSDIRLWVWEGIASGARAVVFWCLNGRNYGIECVGEYALLNLRGKPSKRLLEAKKISEFLNTHRDIFDAASPIDGQISILYADDLAWALDWVQGNGEDHNNPRNKHMGADAASGAYLMCSDLGLTVNMVNEKILLSDEWQKNTRVLIIPSTTAMEEEYLDAIDKFAQNGGTVIADGMFAMKDSHGLLVDYHEKLNKIFGMYVDEAGGMVNEFEVKPKSGNSFPGWFMKLTAEISTGKSIAEFEDGETAAISNTYGKGTAVRILTLLFQRYLTKPTNEALEFFKTILPVEAFNEEIILENTSFNLRLRRLAHPDGELLFLLNKGDEATAEFKSNAVGTLSELGGTSRELKENDKFTIKTNADSATIFLWKRR